MSALVTFDFDGEPVRTAMVDGESWFVGRDACRCLGIESPERAFARIPASEKDMRSAHTLGGGQSMIWLSEAGLYRLIFESRKPAAERFKKWVFGTVLPEIRRTGSFAGVGGQRKAELADVLALARSCELVRRTHGRTAAQRLWTQMGGIDLPSDHEGGGETPPHSSSKPSKPAPTLKPLIGPKLIEFRHVQAFLAECCEEEPYACVQAFPLFAAYSRWALKTGGPPLTSTAFGLLMQRTGFPRFTSSVRSYQGLRLRPLSTADAGA